MSTSASKHRSGPLKQSNKVHKNGRHKSKGENTALDKGEQDGCVHDMLAVYILSIVAPAMYMVAGRVHAGCVHAGCVHAGCVHAGCVHDMLAVYMLAVYMLAVYMLACWLCTCWLCTWCWSASFSHMYVRTYR